MCIVLHSRLHNTWSGATRGACIATRIACPTVPTRLSDDNIYESKQ